MYLQRFSDLSVNSFFSWNSVIYIFLFQSENIFIRKLSQTYWFVSRFDDFLPSDACEKLSAKSHNSVFHFQLHGGHIEAVVHVKEGHDDNMYPEFEDESVAEREDDSLDMLIDSKNNKYVLTRWKEKAFVAELSDTCSRCNKAVVVDDKSLFAQLSRVPMATRMLLTGVWKIFQI